MFGLSSCFPDYCLIVVDANPGLTKMTKEHLGICYAMNLPIIIIMTKIDLALEENRVKNLAKLVRIVSNKGGFNK